MKTKVILVIFFLFSINSFSQSWEKEYLFSSCCSNTETATNAIELKAGGFLALSYGFNIGSFNTPGVIIRLNQQGDTIWTKSIWPLTTSTTYSYVRFYDVIELSDSSLVVVGDNIDSANYNSTGIRVVLDKDGIVLSQSYGALSGTFDRQVIELSKEGGYYTGGADSSSVDIFSAFPNIKKYDSAGNLIWSNKNTTDLGFNSASMISVLSDSGIVCAYNNSSTYSSVVYKLDKNGNLLWNKPYPFYISDILAINNSSVICAADALTTNLYTGVYELTSTGDTLPRKNLGFAPVKIVANNYGGYTILSHGFINPGMQISFLVAYDSIWNTIWQQYDENTYRVVYDFFHMNLVRTSDNGYLFCGEYSTMLTTRKTYIVKTDSVGNTYKGSISGKIIEDDNIDCIYNGVDYPYKNVIVEANNGTSSRYSLSRSTGDYSFKVDTGSYSISHIPKNYRNTICPASNYLVNINTPTDTITGQNFFDKLTSSFTDMAIDLVPPLPPIPGFDYGVYLNYTNIGTDTASGVITITYDSLLTLSSSSVVPSSIVGNTLTFNYNNVMEDSLGSIQFIFNVDSSIALGELIDFSANISTTSSDIDTSNNSDSFTDIVVGSFDPNDKSVQPKGTGTQGYIVGDETMEYIVRFQNTGTYLAQNVIISDSISDNLDMNTFSFLSSSHPCVPSIVDFRTLKFTFQNIDLPDSSTNEAASHGYVKYSIKPNVGISSGAQIKNTAYIYFDFNYPIITSTTLNTIAFPASIEETATTKGNIIVYPNPFNDNTTFAIQSDKLNEIYSFELTDVLGKKVKSKNGISEKQFEISRNGLESGIYFYKIYTAESIVGIGKVVVK